MYKKIAFLALISFGTSTIAQENCAFICQDSEIEGFENYNLGSVPGSNPTGWYPEYGDPQILADGCETFKSVGLDGPSFAFAGSSVGYRIDGFGGPEPIFEEGKMYCIDFCVKYAENNGWIGGTLDVRAANDSQTSALCSGSCELIGSTPFIAPSDGWVPVSFIYSPSSTFDHLIFSHSNTHPLDGIIVMKIDDVSWSEQISINCSADIENYSIEDCGVILLESEDCGNILNYSWFITGNGFIYNSNMQNPIVQVPNSGTYTIELSTLCQDGNVYNDIINITINFDNTPPVISNCPSDMTINTNNSECEVQYQVPTIVATDNIGIVSENYLFDGVQVSAGAILTIDDNIIHNVKYIATDDCGNSDTCEYNITILCETPTNCCKDEMQFEYLIGLGFDITIDSCLVTVTTNQFTECHFITYDGPTWGDLSLNLPVITPANGTWSHTYNSSGIYQICFDVFETVDINQDPCFSKKLCEYVNVFCGVDCDTLPNPEIIAPDICVYTVEPKDTTAPVECLIENCMFQSHGNPNGNPDIPTDNCIPTCDSSIITYYANKNLGSTYKWSTIGGVIIGSDVLDSVNIQWTNINPSKVFLIETLADGCQDSTQICIEFVDSPIANFSFNPSQACLNTNIQFNDLSLNADDWLWDFGDGNISTQKDPTHSFSKAGIYKVLLTVSNSNTNIIPNELCVCKSTCICTDTISMTILVGELPGPPIYCTGTVCKGDTICYNTDIACAGATYLWSVGSNGTILSGGGITDNEICVIWNNGEIGDLSLQIPNCGQYCTLPTEVKIPIIDDSILNIDGPTLVCNGDTELYSTIKYGGSTYDWKVVNGTIVSSTPYSNYVAIKWNDFGNTGKVIVNVDHIKKNCSTTDTLNVILRNTFFIIGNDKVCEEDTGNYFISNNGASNSGFNWTVTGGTILSGNGTNNLTVKWNTGSGNYIIQATPIQPLDFCNALNDFEVEVNKLPANPVILDGPLVVCANNTYNYTADAIPYEGEIVWSVTNGTANPSTGKTTSINWDNSGTGYSISIFHKSNKNPYCVSDTITIPIDALQGINISGPSDVCPNGTSTYTAVLNPSTTSIQGEDITWTINDPCGSIISGQGTNQIVVQWCNNSSSAIISADICGYTDQINVNITPPISPNFNGPTDLCSSDNGIITVSGTYTNFNMSNAIYLNNGNTNPQFQVTGGGAYKFVGFDSNSGGCLVEGVFNINEININAIVNPKGPFTYCVGDNPTTVNVSLSVQNVAGYTYNWQKHCGSGVFVNTGVTSSTYTENNVNTNCYYRCIVNYLGCTEISNVVETKAISCNNPGGGSSGNGEPCMTMATADFNWNICGQVKTFDASLSTNAVSYFWEFEPGMNGSGINPTHTFSSVGDYNVCLTVADANGCLVKNCKIVSVPLIVDFTSNFVDCNNGTSMDPTFQFSDLSVSSPSYSITSYTWKIFDECSNSDIISNLQNPLVEICSTCGAPSSVELTVIAFDGVNTCSNTVTKTITPPGSTAMAIIPTEACVGEIISLQDNSCGDASWLWDYGDGKTSALENHDKTYDNAGIYNITYTVKDIYGCDSDPFTQTITIHDLPSVSLASNPTPAEICEGQNATLTASPNTFTNYNWIDASNNSILSNSTNTATYQAAKTGLYAVEVTDNNGCINTSNPIQVVVYEFPDISIDGDTKFCQGNDLNLTVAPGYQNYSWTISGLSNTSLNSTFNISNIPVGNYVVSVDITDNSPVPCIMTFTTNVIVHPNPIQPIITASPTYPSCEGDMISLQVSNPDATLNYHWSNGATGLSTTLSPALTGSIKVTATNTTTGCSSESNPFTVHPLPDVCIVPEGCYEVCDSDTICLPNYYAKYQWFKDGIAIPGEVGNCIIIEESGKYNVKLETSYGCVDTSGIMDYTVDTACLCKDVDITYTKDSSVSDSCCWLIEIDNQFKPDFFKGIELKSILGGNFSQISVFNNWSINIFNASQSLILPPTTHIPLGQTQVARLCVDNASYHEVELNWLSGTLPDSCVVECSDTLKLNCESDIPSNCISIVEDSLNCETGQYCFKVMNNSNPSFIINKIDLINLSPIGTILTPNPINIPPLSGGNTSDWICTSYSGVIPGDNICFNTIAHFEDMNGHILTCCTDTIQHCSPPIEACSDCCKDFDAFCDLVDLGWQVTIGSQCDVTVIAPQFDTCHWFGTLGPNWGDGPTLPTITPAVPGGPFSHTYTQPGTYNICITVYEGEDENDFCWNKQMCTEVTVDCCISNCDSLDVTVRDDIMTSDSSCCHIVTIENNDCNNIYRGIKIKLQAPATISQLNSLNGWVINQFDNVTAEVYPPSSFIGNGIFDVFSLCTSDGGINPQLITVSWLIDTPPAGNTKEVCPTTLEIENDCNSNKCISIVQDSINCENEMYCFKIRNNTSPNFGITSIDLINISPNGATLIPTPIQIPNGPLLPGTTSDWICVSYGGTVVPGDEVCFNLVAHKEDITQGENPTWCCTDTIAHCFDITEKCNPCDWVSIDTTSISSGDSCCWSIDISNNYLPNSFVGIKAKVLTSGSYFANIASNSPDWNLNYVSANEYDFDYLPNGGFIPLGTFNTGDFCLTGIGINNVEISFLQIDPITLDTIEVCPSIFDMDCPPPPMPCSDISDVVIDCIDNAGNYTISFNISNNTNLQPIGPPGYDFLSYYISNYSTTGSATINPISDNFNPILLPGQTTAIPVSHIINNGTPGETICFSITGHNQLLGNGYQNCCTADTIWCFTLPDNMDCGPTSNCCDVTEEEFCDYFDQLISYSIDSCNVIWDFTSLDSCDALQITLPDGTSITPNIGDSLDYTFIDTAAQTFCFQIERWNPMNMFLPCFMKDTCITIINPCNPNPNPDCCDITQDEFENQFPFITINSDEENCELCIEFGLDSCNYMTVNFDNGSTFNFGPGGIHNPCIFYDSIGLISGNINMTMYRLDQLGDTCITYNTDIDYEFECVEFDCCDIDEDELTDIIDEYFSSITNDDCEVCIPIEIDSCDQLYLEWGDGTDTILQSSATVCHLYANPGVYDILIEIIRFDEDGDICIEAQRNEMIEVNCENISHCNVDGIKIYNAISPNGDGLNEYLEIIDTQYCGRIDISIYNRWGQVVWKQKDYDNTWSGQSLNNEKLPDGTYFLVLGLPDLDDQNIRIHTFIDLRTDK